MYYDQRETNNYLQPYNPNITYEVTPQYSDDGRFIGFGLVPFLGGILLGGIGGYALGNGGCCGRPGCNCYGGYPYPMPYPYPAPYPLPSNYPTQASYYSTQSYQSMPIVPYSNQMNAQIPIQSSNVLPQYNQGQIMPRES